MDLIGGQFLEKFSSTRGIYFHQGYRGFHHSFRPLSLLYATVTTYNIKKELTERIMSSLPSISGSIPKENALENKSKEEMSSTLPKLEMPKNNIQSNDDTLPIMKKSPRISKSPRTVPKTKSPRLSPRLKPIKKDEENNLNKDREIKLDNTVVPKHQHHHHSKIDAVSHLLTRRRSIVQTAEEFAEEAWKAREKFIAFVPRKVLPEMYEMRNKVEERCTSLQGVVSFLDVAGFTKLTERLALQDDGAERLAEIINKLMGQLVGTLKTGDVIK